MAVSALGPNLLLVFINDSRVPRPNLCLFADDISVSVSDSSRSNLEIEIFI